MNHLLLFIILLIFVYEFIKRMNYLYKNKENFQEDFEDLKELNNRTYMEYNFPQESKYNINNPTISNELGIVRNINEVTSAFDDPIPDDFYKPLDGSLFKANTPRWSVCQRDWDECFTYLDPVIEQREELKKYTTENPQKKELWKKMEIDTLYQAAKSI
jgi:hypothetical protein